MNDRNWAEREGTTMKAGHGDSADDRVEIKPRGDDDSSSSSDDSDGGDDDSAESSRREGDSSNMDKLVEAVGMKMDDEDDGDDVGEKSAQPSRGNKNTMDEHGDHNAAAPGEIKSQVPDEPMNDAATTGGSASGEINGGTDRQEGDGPDVKQEERKEELPPASAAEASYPLLVGTLSRSDGAGGVPRHVVRGSWQYENSHAAPPQKFELVRTVPLGEALPSDGTFGGSFDVQHAVKNSKGKLRMKNKTVLERDVRLTFVHQDECPGDGVEAFDVRGTGTNEFGVFELFGTASRNGASGDEEDGPATYGLQLRKKYVGPPSAAPEVDGKDGGGGKKSSGKDGSRKRKLERKEPEELPPPTVLPLEGICLRGKLSRSTSEELSLDNDVVHRITGLWAMKGLRAVLDAPEVCEKFEYEHKCSGSTGSAFPLSGKYLGFFYVNDGGQRTKIAERDVTFRFRKNSAGYHNVEGKGSNFYGKYTITGTLAEDGVFTVFRQFQAPKSKAKKSSKAKAPVPVNGSSSKSSSSSIKSSSSSIKSSSSKPSSSKPSSSKPSSSKSAAAAAPPPSALALTFADVKAPSGSDPVPPLEPPDQFTATSRGILKIEADGTHTCSGSWAMTNEHFASGITSKYHFGLGAQHSDEDARAMLETMKASGADSEDDRRVKGVKNDGVTPVTLAHTTFPVDSASYKGSFKLRKGASRTQTIKDNQIVLRYVRNTGGSYNVYGKGTNEMGTFDLVGTLILQGRSNGLMQLYRMYPRAPPKKDHQGSGGTAPSSSSSASGGRGSKAFRGGLTEKAPENSGPVPTMQPPEPFVASMSGLQRRESTRMVRLPSRLEEDDPQATMDRVMDRCRQILREVRDADAQKIFAAPVDPVSLGIPNYFNVIKDPMDLGTVQARMDDGQIDSPEELSRLVRLTFENAIAYNSMPDNVVNVTARTLLSLFVKKFGTLDKTYNAAKKNRKLTKVERQELKRKEKEAAREAKRRAREEKERKRRAAEEASNESKRMKLDNVIETNSSVMAMIKSAAPKDPTANMTRVEYNLLVDAVKQVQEQIVGLHMLMRRSGDRSSAASTPVDDGDGERSEPPDSSSTSHSKPPRKKKLKREPEPSPPPSPAAAAPAPPEPPVEDLAPLSFEEQEALSESINLLPERLLPGAMQIIREADFVNDDDDEVDLDIDQLDTRTQRKLQKFVMENVKPKKKKRMSKKAKAAAAAAEAAKPVPAAPEASPPADESEHAASGSSKRPPLSAGAGGKSFFALGDDDSDEDGDEEDLKLDFGSNWAAPTQAAEDKEASAVAADGSAGDDLWGAAQKETEASKAREADRAKREEKMRAEAEAAAQKRMEEAAALGEQVRAKREEEVAAEARRAEEAEREAEETRQAAREKALQEVNDVKNTIDLDAQREMMSKLEQDFNDNYSAGASPSSDFGF